MHISVIIVSIRILVYYSIASIFLEFVAVLLSML